ncbi:MAG: hypothetical protein QOE36_3475, partial [Gaiellaceae bacterium]|nr:hypothetical protein [Gaiellaceae bacterium]
MRMPLALRRVVERPDVTILHRFRPPPYGGSNQFLLALKGELERRGLRVSSSAIARRTRACLVHAWLVDVPALRAQLHPECRVVHRVDGPVALYRGRDDGSDDRVAEVNRALAEVTIFQSRFSLEAHRRLGYELRNPFVIPNAVDPALFHPAERKAPGRRLRLIATSWSDNPKKGGETLATLARTLDPALYELTFVGRTPVDLGPARVVPPVGSEQVAELLRGHDVYL